VPLVQQQGLRHSPCIPGTKACMQAGLMQAMRGYLRQGYPVLWQQHDALVRDQLQASADSAQQQQQQRAHHGCGLQSSHHDVAALMQCGSTPAECLVGPEGWGALQPHTCDVCQVDVTQGKVCSGVAACSSRSVLRSNQGQRYAYPVHKASNWHVIPAQVYELPLAVRRLL
jgi:hypothetical protein